jgi:MoxR-like ATPase
MSTDTDSPPPSATAASPQATATLMERVLYEVKRVVVGQDRFLERVLVALLAQACGAPKPPECDGLL